MRNVKPERYDLYLKSRADEICRLVVETDYPAIDIILMINQLRMWCEENLPEKAALFEMVYTSRFRRLWRQFRGKGEPLDI